MVAAVEAATSNSPLEDSQLNHHRISPTGFLITVFNTVKQCHENAFLSLASYAASVQIVVTADEEEEAAAEEAIWLVEEAAAAAAYANAEGAM